MLRKVTIQGKKTYLILTWLYNRDGIYPKEIGFRMNLTRPSEYQNSTLIIEFNRLCAPHKIQISSGDWRRSNTVTRFIRMVIGIVVDDYRPLASDYRRAVFTHVDTITIGSSKTSCFSAASVQARLPVS